MPVEVPLYRTLAEALATGRVAPAAQPADGDPVLLTGPDLPEGAAAIVARTAGGDCVFYHRSSGLCVIHRDAGEDRLPSTCRHFPRLALRDGRGTFMSLTHYCPTAAAMLFRDDVPIEIVEGPAAFPPAEYDGLVCCRSGVSGIGRSRAISPRKPSRRGRRIRGVGVLTIVRGLDAALALVRVEAARQCRAADRALHADLLREAFRQADVILNHLAVGENLAAAWARGIGDS